MRHILLSTILLSLPLAVVAEEEDTQSTTRAQDQQQTQQTQQQDQQQQDQGMQSQPISTEQTTQQQTTQQQTTQQQAGQQQASQAAGGGEAEVARAQFTSKVQDREPVDEVSDEFQMSEEPLYFFTEVKNAAGQTVTHRWIRDGEVVAEVPLQVGSDAWRTWSSKELTPEMEGEWTVEVVDAQGNTLTEESINIEASQQMQNVGYQEQDQEMQTQDPTMQQTQGTQTQDPTMQQTQGTQQDTQSQDAQGHQEDQVGSEEEDGEWQTDALPEEIDYEETESEDEVQQEDDQTGQDY